MRYIAGEKIGEKIRLGDFLSIGGDLTGVVVYDYDNIEFYPEFESWSILGCGILIKSKQIGVVHYPMPHMELEIIERKGEE